MRAYPLLLLACAGSCAAAAARRLDTECAYLLLSESTAWKDDNDQSNFAFRFKAPQWPQYQQVVITFSRPVSVNEIYNAAMVSGATGSTELVVQLGPQPTDDRTFTVMGTGTLSMHPRVVCPAAPEYRGASRRRRSPRRAILRARIVRPDGIKIPYGSNEMCT